MKCNSCGYEMTELENGSYECHVAWCPERKRGESEILRECIYCDGLFAFETNDKEDMGKYEEYVCQGCAVKCGQCGHPKGEHFVDEYGAKYCGITISGCECNGFKPVKGKGY